MSSNFHAQIVPCRLEMGGIYRMGTASKDTITESDLFSSSKINLYIYPNPTNENIKINSNRELKGCKFSIRTTLGNTIQAGIIQDMNSEIVLDDLKAGLYFLTVELNGQEVNTKFIKL